MHVLTSLLQFVAASVGTLFINAKEGKIICLSLEEIGHPQLSSPIHCNDSIATGIANDTVKKCNTFGL